MIDPGLAEQVALLRDRPASPGLAKILSAGTAAIVTGQQPALGGGPLYTVLKTAHAVALARELTRQGRPCRAVHWVASEDHDLGEAGHADLLSREGRVTRVQAPWKGPRAALRHQAAETGHHDLRIALEATCGPGLGRQFLDQLLPIADEDLGRWQVRWLKACFPDLLVVQPQDLRSAGADTLLRALEGWDHLIPDLLAAGWTSYFGHPSSPPFFDDLPTGRRAVERTEARHLLTQEPQRVSTGAGLRPVLQQATLPVLAYVGGPGEIAYHQALAPLFRTLELPAPYLIPRMRAILAPSWYLRGCLDWGMDPQSPVMPISKPPPDAALASLQQTMEIMAGREDLRGSRARLARIYAQLSRRQTRRAHPTSAGALIAWAHPREAPQDRVLSCWQAWWEWGPGLAERLISAAGSPTPCLIRP